MKRKRYTAVPRLSPEDFANYVSLDYLSAGVDESEAIYDTAERVRKLAELITLHDLKPFTFFYTPYGEALIKKFTENMAHLIPVDPADVDERGTQVAELALKLGYIATIWEMAFSMSTADGKPLTVPSPPGPGGNIFEYESTYASRVQFFYRFMEAAFSDDRWAYTRHAVLNQLPSVDPDVSSERIKAILMTELWLSGNNEFVIGAELRNLFMHMDILKMKTSEITFPYKAFHISTPQEHIMFSILEGDSIPDPNIRVWTILNSERGCVKLREDIDKDLTLGELWGKLPADFWAKVPNAEHGSREAFELICNLCLYLESVGSEVKELPFPTPKVKTTSDAARLRDKARRGFTPVKRELYPALAKQASRSDGGATSRTRGATVQHWVRGHYRMQPVGPRDNVTYKRIFIEPHIRGSDAPGKSTKTRKYKV